MSQRRHRRSHRPRLGGARRGLVSTLDLLDDGLTLFVGPDWRGFLPNRRASSPPVTVERLDAIAARGLGLTTAGSLLARPDGYPVALWNDEEAGRVRFARAIAAASGSAWPETVLLSPAGP